MRNTRGVHVDPDHPDHERPDPDAADDAATGEHDGDAAGSEIEDLAIQVPMALIPVLAVAFVALMWAGFGTDPVLFSVVPFVVLLAAITVIDLRELRVPNKLTGPAALLALPLLLLSATSDWADLSIGRALLGALVYGAFYFVVWFIYPPGMGFGDVKLAPIIGAQVGLFGWVPLVRSLIFGHLVSGLVAVAIILVGLLSRGRMRWRTAFPFAPFMVIGAVGALALEAFG